MHVYPTVYTHTCIYKYALCTHTCICVYQMRFKENPICGIRDSPNHRQHRPPFVPAPAPAAWSLWHCSTKRGTSSRMPFTFGSLDPKKISRPPKCIRYAKRTKNHCFPHLCRLNFPQALASSGPGPRDSDESSKGKCWRSKTCPPVRPVAKRYNGRTGHRAKDKRRSSITLPDLTQQSHCAWRAVQSAFFATARAQGHLAQKASEVGVPGAGSSRRILANGLTGVSEIPNRGGNQRKVTGRSSAGCLVGLLQAHSFALFSFLLFFGPKQLPSRLPHTHSQHSVLCRPPFASQSVQLYTTLWPTSPHARPQRKLCPRLALED